MTKKHKYATLIKAWADGAEVEYRFQDGIKGWGEWTAFDDGRFLTDPWWEYRLKPNPDVVFTTHIEYDFGWKWINTTSIKEHNLRLKFDNKTGKLKSAEVL